MPSPSSEKTTQSGDTPTPSDLRSPKTSLNVAHIVSILTKHSCEYTPEKAAMMLGESPLVAIGEGTHRSKEMFNAQYDIIKQRIEKHACRVVFIEADASDVAIIMKAAEAGDMERTRELLQEFFFPTLSSNGICELIQFVAQWNREHRDDPVHFVGIDIQSRGATTLLRQTAKGPGTDDQLRVVLEDLCLKWDETLARMYGRKETPKGSQSITDSCVEVSKLAEAVLPRLADSESKIACEGICKYALFFSQPQDVGMANRDKLMAERINTYPSAQHASGAVIAFNGHVTFAPKTQASGHCISFSEGMGTQITKQPYKVLLQLAEKGTLSGLSSDTKKEELKAFPELRDSDLEKVLALVAKELETEKPILINVDSLKSDPEAVDLVEREFSVHSIGKNILTDYFAYIRLSNVCNGILFHRNITPETWA